MKIYNVKRFWNMEKQKFYKRLANNSRWYAEISPWLNVEPKKSLHVRLYGFSKKDMVSFDSRAIIALGEQLKKLHKNKEWGE